MKTRRILTICLLAISMLLGATVASPDASAKQKQNENVSHGFATYTDMEKYCASLGGEIEKNPVFQAGGVYRCVHPWFDTVLAFCEKIDDPLTFYRYKCNGPVPGKPAPEGSHVLLPTTTAATTVLAVSVPTR